MSSLDIAALVSRVGPTESLTGIEAFFARIAPPAAASIELAIAAAMRVDRLAYVFAGGYAAALRALVPHLPERGDGAPGLMALAATENKSAHPRDIRTTYTAAGTLVGGKSFVTLGTIADTLLVVARTETPREDGRPCLRLVSVKKAAAGITVESLRETPFAPEMPHARARFEGAAATPLEGDGYDRYLKPFRTVEDVYVHNALIAWLLAMSVRDGWSASFVARAGEALVRARALVALDPTAAETHLALGESIAEARALAEDVGWSSARAAERAMWERDKPLLWIAERARTERLSRARARIA